MNKKTLSPAETVREFYDSYGWRAAEASETSWGELLFQDLDDYALKHRLGRESRYQIHFGQGGRFFLDAGCGGEPRPDMSVGFETHVCADFSIVGLKAARERLGNADAYVLADLTALPFKKNAFDAVLAAHCLYHIDGHQQVPVLNEMYRATRPGKNILVYYSSRVNLVTLLHKIPRVLIPLVNHLFSLVGLRLFVGPPYFRRRPKASPQQPPTGRPPLYSHTHNPKRLAREFPSADVTCLMTLTTFDTKLLRRVRLLRPAIWLSRLLEGAFPHAMVYVGKYACIRIEVDSDGKGA